jgi:hypothetical protein
MKRLDCAFEQIILDFPEEYGNDPELIAKARTRLARTRQSAMKSGRFGRLAMTGW